MITVKIVRAGRGRRRRNQHQVQVFAANHRELLWSETYDNRDDARSAWRLVEESILSGQVDYVDVDANKEH